MLRLNNRLAETSPLTAPGPSILRPRGEPCRCWFDNNGSLMLSEPLPPAPAAAAGRVTNGQFFLIWMGPCTRALQTHAIDLLGNIGATPCYVSFREDIHPETVGLGDEFLFGNANVSLCKWLLRSNPRGDLFLSLITGSEPHFWDQKWVVQKHGSFHVISCK